MAKARKLRLVEVREPNGRISRARDEREYPPGQVKRLRDAAMLGLRDQEWGTEMGRMFLDGTLTAEMYAAGKWWRETAAKYQQAICAPPPDARAVSFQIGRGASPIDPDSEAGKTEARRHSAATVTFLESHAALMGAGLLAERAVRRLCEQDEAPIGEEQRQSVKRGLLWIAKYRGLTPDSKSRNGYVR